LGLVLGVLAATAGSALAEGDAVGRGFVTSVLYTLGELAIDTELNATRIAELGDRIDDLELRLDDVETPKN